ncbi:MAG: hemolysin family protein [Polyangiaceae bacterium]
MDLVGDAGPATSLGLALVASTLGAVIGAGVAALSELPEGFLRSVAEEHSRRGVIFARFLAHRDRIHARWFVARIAAVSTAAACFCEVGGRMGLGGATVFVAVLAAVAVYGTVSEVLMTLARHAAEDVAAIALVVFRPIEWCVIPVADPLAALGRLLARRFAPTVVLDTRATEAEVSLAVSEGQKTGALPKEPADMIRNVLHFTDRTARDVMIPRRRITGIEIGTSLDDALRIVATEGHSRYPVFKETIDNVLGLFYAKDLFALVRDPASSTKKLADIVRMPVLFVAETQSALSILREMRSRRLHLAVVSDEFGGTSGIVTLEDIIEEIVGDIRDEYDADPDHAVTSLDGGRLLADAAISISDLRAHLGRDVAHDTEFESLGGLLVGHAGRVPEAGATMEMDGMRFIVREADETHVKKVEIVPSEPPPAPADEAADDEPKVVER